MLINVIERYCKRNRLSSECVLVDKIYRKRKEYKLLQITWSPFARPAFGNLQKNSALDKRIEYLDAVDKIEVERAFGLTKMTFDHGLITM